MLGMVFSGGGAKGCFQVGAIQEMQSRGIIPDMVAGVSTGNLQAVMIAQGKYDILYQLWNSIKQSDIYEHKILSFLGIIFGAKSIYDYKPLYRLIKKYVSTGDFKIPFRCGTVCLEDGKYYSITEKHDSLHEFIYASASMPVIAEPVVIGGKLYVDGGVRNMTPLKEAVSFGCDHIIVVLCSPRAIDEKPDIKNRAIPVGSRSLSIILNEIYNEDLSYAFHINEQVEKGMGGKYRKIRFTIIEPDYEVIDTTEFNRGKLNAGIEHGRQVAKRVLDKEGITGKIHT